MKGGYFVLLLFFVLSVPFVHAGIEVREFPDARLEQRYHRLIGELRCLVCQNQSLADSNADLAEDLRDEVYAMLMAGKPDREIVAFLVARYGDFVLYRPPVKKTTLLLWLGPFAALLVAGWVLWRIGKARTPEPAAPLNEEEQQKVRKLLQQQNREEPGS